MQQFTNYQSKVLQEKLFLHTDKEFYLAGEILWFKLYYVEGSTHRPLDISKIAYVEVLDRDKKPVLQTKVSLSKGKGNGSLLLPQTLTSDQYTIRAYTHWMKNFAPEFFFEKQLTLVNTLYAQEETETRSKERKYDIQFFPEGGNLVQGIESKVAFRAVNQEGKGIRFRGFLLSHKNDTLVRFQPSRFGIGAFTFTPVAGMRYRAVIIPEGAKPQIMELPKVFEQGYTLSLAEPGNGKIRLTVSTASTAAGPTENVYLIGHTRQQAKVAAVAALYQGKAVFTMEAGILGEGITNFTLFNSIQQPVCERLYFKKPTHLLSIEGGPEATTYATRQRVDVQLTAADHLKVPQEANLSMAVYLLDSLQALPKADLLSYLYLTSDLKGTIESPEYYLQNNSAETKEAVDHLMLTHGWRRFAWQDVQRGQTPVVRFAPEYEGLLLSGVITDKKTGASAPNVSAFLSVPDTLPQFYGGISNSKGEVQFSIYPFT